jgi:hypothetical protein
MIALLSPKTIAMAILPSTSVQLMGGVGDSGANGHVTIQGNSENRH